MPQVCVMAPVQVCPTHSVFHWQLSPQVCVPPAPQVRVCLGEQEPAPLHTDQSDHVPLVMSQVRVCAPQLPHACVGTPVHIWPLHAASHWQLPPQICVPWAPQVRIAFGAHGPSMPQAEKADHLAVAVSQVRVSVPQLPHAVEGAPAHT
jgi:hypothetical protein